MTDHARPPEGVETWKRLIAQILSEHHVTFRSRTVIYRRQIEFFYEMLTSALVDAFLPVLLAEREKLDRITARLTDLGVIAPEGRDADGERFDVADTVLALLDGEREAKERAEREIARLTTDAREWRRSDTLWRYQHMRMVEADRDAAVARAEQAEKELATYVNAHDRRVRELEALRAERDEHRAMWLSPCDEHRFSSNLTEMTQCPKCSLLARAEQAEAERDGWRAECEQRKGEYAELEADCADAERERDELRKKLGDGNDEGTSTTAEAARGPESRNRKRGRDDGRDCGDAKGRALPTWEAGMTRLHVIVRCAHDGCDAEMTLPLDVRVMMPARHEDNTPVISAEAVFSLEDNGWTPNPVDDAAGDHLNMVGMCCPMHAPPLGEAITLD